IVLSDTSERELVHEVNLVRRLHVFVLRICQKTGDRKQRLSNLTLNVFTTSGNVALNNMTCRSLGQKPRSCSMTGVNSGESSLSASSMTNVWQAERSATPFPARSKIRPGVPTMI